MPDRPVLLVNTNTLRPPVSPVGLEYVGESLVERGIPVRVVDLAFAADWRAALTAEITAHEPLLVGLTVRNTDDCSFATRQSFLPWAAEVASAVKALTKAPVVLGGVGLSVMPEAVLRVTGADFAVAGDGEDALAAIAECIDQGRDPEHVPGLVGWRDGAVFSNPREFVDARRWPVPRRRLFDNPRYQALGAMVGIETKRGCAGRCIFCGDPVAKGARVRLRPAETVVAEFGDLVAQGVTWFHLADAEFNLPPSHARAVCRAIIDARLGDRINWTTYAAPAPFDRELARLMRQAGCRGINFGVDSLCDDQLARLARGFTYRDLRALAAVLKETGIDYILDLLVGGPGETEDTVRTTIERVRELDVPLAGIAAGVRVYPGTPLARAVAEGRFRDGLHGSADPAAGPLFYLSPEVGPDPFGLVARLVQGDPRFLFLASPEAAASYNYAGDDTLARLIEEGARGAYWQILARHRPG